MIPGGAISTRRSCAGNSTTREFSLMVADIAKAILKFRKDRNSLNIKLFRKTNSLIFIIIS